jgi:soluble lytic murein transglycosylase-like protein
MSVNGGVRALGGDVSWLSISRFSERSEALARFGVHSLGMAFRDRVEPIAALRQAAIRHQLPESLVLAVAKVESDFVPTRVSATGAMGLMQLMPRTADQLGVRDPFDAQQNADGGASYLKLLLTQYRGDLRKALAAYNAGPSRISGRASHTLPNETRAYVARVLAGSASTAATRR